ncbi:ABC transporter substrate-binding protein [Neptuniibacter marinus]|uniref:ABC transporter substrate-binding protein n=1 Tax=Neptuniibacter marinus TaxID=1806670 RepID=UPI003B5BACF6
MKKRKFRQGLFTAFFIFLLTLLNGCSSSKDPLVVATHIWPGYTFMYLADQLGWVDTAQISFQNTYSASESLELIKEGKVEAATLTFDEVIRARSEGIELTVVAILDISAGADQVISRTRLSQLSDIKGKRIGVEISALGTVVLSHLLDQAGLTKDDITVVDITIDDQETAWLDGKIDCVITYEPVARKLIMAGGYKVFDSRSMPEIILDVLAVKTATLHKREQITHLIDAHFKALRHFDVQREDALYRMAPRLGMEPDLIPFLFEGLLLPNRSNNQRLMVGSPSKVERVGNKIIEVMAQSGLLNAPVNTDNLVDSRFVSP